MGFFAHAVGRSAWSGVGAQDGDGGMPGAVQLDGDALNLDSVEFSRADEGKGGQGLKGDAGGADESGAGLEQEEQEEDAIADGEEDDVGICVRLHLFIAFCFYFQISLIMCFCVSEWVFVQNMHCSRVTN